MEISISAPTKLSIIIPAFNEEATILQIIQKIEDVSFQCPIELIIVDDGSTDGTRELLLGVTKMHKVIFLEKNSGKGAAIRVGIKHVTGTHVVVQDADLEYNPKNLAEMIDIMLKTNTLVLYGSRSMLAGRNKNAGFSFYWGGQLVTWVANILYDQKLTDEPTCYKMFEASLLTSLPLRCEGFEFCPEVTALVAKRGVKIKEVPIDYYPRDIAHGKKIKWLDGVEAIYVLIKNRL